MRARHKGECVCMLVCVCVCAYVSLCVCIVCFCMHVVEYVCNEEKYRKIEEKLREKERKSQSAFVPICMRISMS